jgi:hypothetical protein
MRRNPCRRKKRQKKSIFIYGTTFKKNESGRDFQQGQIWNDRSQKQNRTTAGTQYYCLLYDIYGNHTFCCKRGSKKRAHNVIAMDFAGALSLLFLHKPATFFLTHPRQSNHCSTSTQTRQHDRSTFHSLLIPPHMPPLPIHRYWGRHQHHRPPAYPQPTNLTLKTL